MTDDPDVLAAATASFLDERDDGERTLEAVLEVDAEHETWTFDDVPIDSGTFGELVSRGIVEKVDGEYRVADADVVAAVMAGEELETDTAGESFDWVPSIDLRTWGDRRALLGLVGALLLVVAMRLLNYRSVFRDDRVVSPGNDPYYYRYWMEELLASHGRWDWSAITAMPDGAAGTRPFTHAANWFFASLLGGDQWAAETVAAWSPVVATVGLAIVVYLLAVVVTDDVRVGLASVLLLALTPVHAVYTSAGFLEHRLYQYVWLGVTILTLSWLAVALQRRRESAVRAYLRQPWTWVASFAFGLSLALSAHAWGGSVLMFVPVAAYVGLKVAVDVRDGLSPGLANAPVLVGLGVAAAVSAFLHFRWGWHETFTGVVPALVVGGCVGVCVLGELWRRFEWPVGGLVGLEAGLAGGGILGFRRLRPEDWARLRERADDLFFREHHGATEIGSLFSTENSIIFEPMVQLGLTFYVALVVLGWACWIAYRRYEPGWLLLAVYGVFWLALAAFQVRFAAQLAIPLSVLGGLGLVYLLAWIDLARVPRPFREGAGDEREIQRGRDAVADGGKREPSLIVPDSRAKLGTCVLVVVVLCSMSLLFVPSLTAQTTYSESQFEAAMAIEDHAADVDREYPENFVLSPWGDNRMYNYFVNGESRSYGYAASNFDEFVAADDPDGWYDQFDGRVGYVVMTERDGYPSQTSQVQLHEHLGTGDEEREPLAHYQAIYVDNEVTAFAVVSGANITGSGEPGETVSVETEVSVSGESLTYERAVTVDEDGSFAVTVPYDGEYTVAGESVEVSATAVEQGETVALE